jgi:hypothetical protein
MDRGSEWAEKAGPARTGNLFNVSASIKANVNEI